MACDEDLHICLLATPWLYFIRALTPQSMSNPEWENRDSQEGLEREPRFTLSLTKRQLEVLLISVHDDLIESKNHLDQMPNNMQHADDYETVARHLSDLHAIREVITASLNK